MQQTINKSTIRVLSLFLITLFSSLNIYGQNLKDYKWNNRIVLIISNTEDSEVYNKQTNALEKDLAELKERKIIIFKVLPSKFQINTKQWQYKSELFENYNPNNEAFKIVLIGLDGGIKLNENNFLPSEQLYALIDGMPMRRAELRNKN